jgi:hypothetical protein
MSLRFPLVRSKNQKRVAGRASSKDASGANEDLAPCDAFAQAIGELTPITRDSAVAQVNQMIANILDPNGYAVWMVPVVSARVGRVG